MLIYNFKKEFIGADEEILNLMGFEDLEQFTDICQDFAQLLVKAPGYITDFKDIHWIDYILASEGELQTSKVIFHINDKNFQANISAKIIYLNDSPKSKAYCITLTNVKELKDSDVQYIIDEVQTIIQQLTKEKPKIKEQIKTTPVRKQEVKNTQPLNKVEKTHHTQSNPIKQNTKTDKKVYTYNPNIAAQKLGLEPKLIEEFLSDFISQANAFRDELYYAIEDENLESVKSLSHQLKGIASNLMIEEAKKLLIIINQSNDFENIKEKLDKFYILIADLAKRSGQEDEISSEIEPIIQEPKTIDEPVAIEPIENKVILEEKPTIIEPNIEDEPINIVPLELDIYNDEDDNNKKELKTKEPVEQKTQDKEYAIELLDIQEENNSNEDDIHYNKKVVANEIGLDIQSFNELFKDFESEANTICKTIHQNIDIDNFSSAKKEIKKLKSMCQNLKINTIIVSIDDFLQNEDKENMQKTLTMIESKLKKISNG